MLNLGEEEFLRIQANSNSKDIVDLQKHGDKYFISKKWSNIDRGYKSIRKQINFHDIKSSNIIIRSPTVYSTQKNDEGNFEAIMEYVDGYSGSEIALNGNRDKSLGLKDALSLILSINIERSNLKEISNRELLLKLDNILISKNISPEICKMIKSLRDIIFKHKYLKIPIGHCHGDLTLSNIIISQTGAFNLIDFLPTFIESPLWDIVKLYQDLHYGWSYRNESGPLKVSAKIFFESCMPNLMNFFEKAWEYEILLFDSINLARLAPYIKDNKTHNWVSYNLKNSLSKLN